MTVERLVTKEDEFEIKYIPEKIDGNFAGKHIVSVEQFNRPDLDQLFATAREFRDRHLAGDLTLLDIARGKTIIEWFSEASSRTDLSFQNAILRIGGQETQPSNGTNFSSEYKGEVLPDTIRMAACYADAVVLRHPDEGSSYLAAHYIDMLMASEPSIKSLVISAGDGIGEHPTQALLDLFTIEDLKGLDKNLVLTMVGDLKHGRTVHSLAKLLAQNGHNVSITFVSPDSLRMPENIMQRMGEAGISTYQTDNINEVIGISDIVYWTRVQEERFTCNEEYEAEKDKFILTPELLAMAKHDAAFMHPLPRKNEMGDQKSRDILDNDPRTAWFRQMNNGMYIRMALLAKVLGRA